MANHKRPHDQIEVEPKDEPASVKRERAPAARNRAGQTAQPSVTRSRLTGSAIRHEGPPERAALDSVSRKTRPSMERLLPKRGQADSVRPRGGPAEDETSVSLPVYISPRSVRYWCELARPSQGRVVKYP
jgi:hypothetical protein